MKVRNLLETKRKAVTTIDGGKTVEDAIRVMHRKKIGAVIVVEKKETAGIFTERDIVRLYMTRKMDRRFRETPVREAMTRKLVVAELDDALCDIMAIMVDMNIRHLPVVDKGKIVGMLSSRDIIQAQVGTYHSEIHHLKNLITS
jgi:IMP dehydrogenase